MAPQTPLAPVRSWNVDLTLMPEIQFQQPLSSALPEQLGLMLADDALPLDVLVIDRAERPAL